MRITTLAGAALVTAGLAVASSSSTAHALPLCGGNQKIQTAPVDCTNSRTIDGTTFTVELHVTAGGAVSVLYTLDAPRAVDTPIRVRSHVGISSGPTAASSSSVISAGATSGTLTVTLKCGQVDVKAVYTGNGDARGRIAGPYVTTGNNCGVDSTSIPTTPTVPTTPAPVVPGPTPPTGPGTPTSPPAQITGSSVTPTVSGGELPATGTNVGLLLLVVTLLVSAGYVMHRRAESA